MGAKLFAAGKTPNAVAVADVNGDGLPDAITTSAADNTVNVLLGKSTTASHFRISAPSSVKAGTLFTITVTALTPDGAMDSVYTGTVRFTSSDGSAVLPAPYTFTVADGGRHTFAVILNTTSPSTQTITVTDTADSTITGTAGVTVNPPGASPPPASGRSGRAATTSAESAAAGLSALHAATARDGVGLARAASDFGPAPTGSAFLPRQGPGGTPAAVVSNDQPVPSALAPHRLAARAALDEVFANRDSNLFSDTLGKDEVPAWAV
jgi:hypothetical protein